MDKRQLCLTIQYDGTNYKGSQRQLNATTIQSVLEAKLSKITGKKTTATFSGRTDSGVHALCQVVSFKTTSHHCPEVFLKALNALLPDDIQVMDCYCVPLNFHPRYMAKKKRYFYMIQTSPLKNPFVNRYLWHIKTPLNVEAMASASKHLVGCHDFKTFCASNTDVSSTIRELYKLDVEIIKELAFMSTQISGTFTKISAEANGFLRHMVRNITGTIVDVGKGKLQPSNIVEILQARNRQLAGQTAPSKGLFLEKVYY